MVNDTEPLPFYKEPLYYTGLVALIGIGLVIYSVVGNNVSSNLMVPSAVVAFIFGAATYFMWNTRCPHCKRPFVKVEDLSKEKDLGIRKAKRHFVSEIHKTKEDDVVEEIKDYTIWPARFVQRFFYCKKCDYGKNNEWHDDEKGTFKGWEDNDKWNPPKPRIIYVKENEDGDYIRVSKKGTSNGKLIVQRLTKQEAEKIIMDRGNKCEYPHCRENISLEVHHIVARSNGGTNRPSNLIVLCPTHHHKADRGSINATRLKMIVSKK